MAIKTVSELEDVFITGATPTEQDFSDLLESFVHLTDTLGAYQVLIRNAASGAAAGLTVPASTFVGRKDTGDIVAISVSDAQAMLGVGVPTGVVVPFAAAAVPGGWKLCDGSAISRTTYAALFAAIGTTYGAGDGTTTFNLPDLRGRAAVGASVDHTLAVAFGAATFDAHHTHTVTPNILAIHEGENVSPTNVAAATEATTSEATLTVPTVPPSLALNFIIKA